MYFVFFFACDCDANIRRRSSAFRQLPIVEELSCSAVECSACDCALRLYKKETKTGCGKSQIPLQVDDVFKVASVMSIDFLRALRTFVKGHLLFLQSPIVEESIRRSPFLAFLRLLVAVSNPFQIVFCSSNSLT